MLRKIPLTIPNFASVFYGVSIFLGDFLVGLSRQPHFIIRLFNGFQKKTQKTPLNEIEKAMRIKKEYFESKKLKT